MIRSPLQHHRSRVPAIPPKLSPLTLAFTIDERAAQFGFMNGIQPWSDFMQCVGLNTKCAFTLENVNAATSKARERGFSIRIDRFSDMGDQTLTLTVTRPARISPKLLATFPWKLRKHLKP